MRTRTIGRLAGALALGLLASACADASRTVETSVPPTVATAATTSTASVTTTAAPPSTTAAAPPTTSAPTTSTPPPTTSASPSPPCPDVFGAGTEAGGRMMLFRTTGEEAWSIPLGARRVRAMLLTDVAVVAGLDDGSLAALDPADCRELWTASGPAPVVGLALDGPRLLVTDGASVRLLAAATGEPIWQLGLLSDSGVALVTAGPVVVVDRAAGSVRAVDEDGSLAWEAQLQSGSLVGLTSSEDLVFVMTDASVVARELTTGSRAWTASVDLADPLPPTLDGGTVYLAGGGVLEARDRKDGSLLWTRQIAGAGEFLSPPRVDHNELHVLDDLGRLHHLDRSDGTSLFTGEFGPETGAAFDDKLVIVPSGSELRGFNLLERLQWSIDTRGGRPALLDADGDRILLVLEGG